MIRGGGGGGGGVISADYSTFFHLESICRCVKRREGGFLWHAGREKERDGRWMKTGREGGEEEEQMDEDGRRKSEVGENTERGDGKMSPVGP